MDQKPCFPAINAHDVHKEIKFDGVGTDGTRIIGACILTALSLPLCVIIAKLLVSDAGWGNILGITSWMILLAFSIKLFFIPVPAVTGAITTNAITGALHVYCTGFFLNVKYPWERYTKDDYISLRLTEVTLEEDYPAADGPKIKVKAKMQYKPTVGGLPYYIAVNATDIEQNLKAVASNFLTRKIGELGAEIARGRVEEFQQEILGVFEKTDDAIKAQRKHPLEHLYGIDMVLVTIDDVDYEPHFQKMFSTRAVARKARETARELRNEEDGLPDLSDKDALNSTLIMNGDVTKKIIEAEGEGVKGFASFVLAALGGDKDIGEAPKKKRGKGDRE